MKKVEYMTVVRLGGERGNRAKCFAMGKVIDEQCMIVSFRDGETEMEWDQETQASIYEPDMLTVVDHLRELAWGKKQEDEDTGDSDSSVNDDLETVLAASEMRPVLKQIEGIEAWAGKDQFRQQLALAFLSAGSWSNR